MAELKRTLGLAECIFFGVGSILGAGIYALVGKVAGMGGNMVWLSFLIASFTALLSAFSYAELSAAFPKAGAEYVFASKAFGKKTGAILGIFISLNGVISGATVALGFGGYFAKLVEVPVFLAALGVLILLYGINISGIRQSSIVNIIFTCIELVGLGLVVYAASSHLGDIDYTELPPEGIHGLLAASALSFYAYVGFEDLVKLSEETKKPEKNIPRALFSANIIVAVVYTFVAVCAVSAIPFEELEKSKSPLADIVNNKFGFTGVITISVIALFSTSNTILSNMISSSRVLFDMSGKIRLLQKFSNVSAKRKTPVAALTLVLVVMGLFAIIGNIKTVALIANFFIFITFLMINIAVIVLRLKDKELSRPYRIPGNIKGIPLISMLGILMTSLLLGYTIFSLGELNAE